MAFIILINIVNIMVESKIGKFNIDGPVSRDAR